MIMKGEQPRIPVEYDDYMKTEKGDSVTIHVWNLPEGKRYDLTGITAGESAKGILLTRAEVNKLINKLAIAVAACEGEE